MNPIDARKRINRLLQALDEIPSGGPLTAGWDQDEALLVWDALEGLAAEARSLARSHSHVLAERLPVEYTHPKIGMVHTDLESKTTWDGNAVLTALSTPHAPINTDTGEIGPLVDAIPTATLRQVLPAVGPNQTSSKWNKGGLAAAGLQPGMYSVTDYGVKVLRRGPKYRRNRRRPDE